MASQPHGSAAASSHGQSNVGLLSFYHSISSKKFPSEFKTVPRKNRGRLVATKIPTGTAEKRRISKRITEAGKHFFGPNQIRMRLRCFPCRCKTRFRSQFDRLLRYELHFGCRLFACWQKYIFDWD